MKRILIILFIFFVIAQLSLSTERMTVAILVHDRMSEKISYELKSRLMEDIKQHYNIDLSVVTWISSQAIKRVDMEGNHYLNPIMKERGYDYVVTIRAIDRMFEFVVWSKNFFTNSVFLPIDAKMKFDDFVETAVNSLLSIIEYAGNNLYRNKLY
ncbi:MAG: hypothetical protein KAW12_04635 [Candidatus Aminicenantes bacterium]|nr:hypothetical protein [Candidatus Aminicenantes bacterium]